MFTTNKLASLQKKSKQALGVFQATVVNLAAVNEEIDKEIASTQEQIKALKENENQLLEISVGNQTFITKINEFLGVV